MATYFDPAALQAKIQQVLGEHVMSMHVALNELNLRVASKNWIAVAKVLRDTPELGFEQMLDLCGVDYSEYRDGEYEGPRYAVVCQLLSVCNNHRVRVSTFCANDDLPTVDSLTEVWSSAEWYEREAFDLFGIVFEGHRDLRRILTDYGFIGHPFRKDFPVSGHVEMRYDAERKRVIYQPVTIEPREITPRVIREDNYAGIDPNRGVK